MSVLTKECSRCGKAFRKRERDSMAQWEDRSYCSALCSNRDKPVAPLHLRFWDNVDRAEGNRCWTWTGPADEHGYGKLGYGGRDAKAEYKAHRMSYEMRFGPISAGKVICHTCDNPSCVNPNHLFEGTQKDNTQDTSRKGRLNPISLLNLRPGAPGHQGAGPLANKERIHGWQR